MDPILVFINRWMSNEDLADTQKSIIQLQRKIKFDWKDMDLENTILAKPPKLRKRKELHHRRR